MISKSEKENAERCPENYTGRVKAFSALVAQGAALIRSRSMPDGTLGASFGDLAGFWRTWSDAAHQPGSAQAGFGGVVVDESGQSVAAFSEMGQVQGGRKGAALAEVLALERALSLAWEAGARKIEARFDCLPVARAAAAVLMGEPGELDKPESVALLAVLTRFECVALRWAPRESNRLADALSKRPLGGGLFHGGDSQQSQLTQAWANPAAALPAGDAREERRRQAREEHVGRRFGAGDSGTVRVALGARWRDDPESGGGWLAAASLAEPMAKRDGRLEASEFWALGASSQPGASGLADALSQALAKKAADACGREGGAVSKFVVYLPELTLAPLRSSGLVDDFAQRTSVMLKTLAPGATSESRVVEASPEIGSRHAAHLQNGWELGRAAVIQQLRGARAQKRLDRSRRSVSSPPSS